MRGCQRRKWQKMAYIMTVAVIYFGRGGKMSTTTILSYKRSTTSPLPSMRSYDVCDDVVHNVTRAAVMFRFPWVCVIVDTFNTQRSSYHRVYDRQK